MEHFEATTHPFIVRIWLEESAEEADRATWRGYVTHVPSGERRYIHALDEIVAFIAPYVESMGVRLSDPGPTDKTELAGHTTARSGRSPTEPTTPLKLGRLVRRLLGDGRKRRRG
jgi:hypothetical protein